MTFTCGEFGKVNFAVSHLLLGKYKMVEWFPLKIIIDMQAYNAPNHLWPCWRCKPPAGTGTPENFQYFDSFWPLGGFLSSQITGSRLSVGAVGQKRVLAIFHNLN